MPDSPGTPGGDLQLVLDALTRAAVVIIAAAGVTVCAFLGYLVAVKWTLS